jgi:hypothetical protein
MKASLFASFFFFAVTLVQALPTPQVLGGGGGGDLIGGVVGTVTGVVGDVVGTAGGLVGGAGKATTKYLKLLITTDGYTFEYSSWPPRWR